MKTYLLAIALVFLSSCGQVGPSGSPGPAGATTVASPAPAVGETVQELINAQNAYRLSIGQDPLQPGLACTLYTVPQTTTLIIGATGLVSVGAFEYDDVFNVPNQSTSVGLTILPTALQGVYQTWYIVKCTASLVVADSNYHEFDITSDDGSNLYVDGLLINNDGLHGAQTKSATKYLQYGIHTFELDYLQANGNESLILNEDNALMQATGFYH